MIKARKHYDMGYNPPVFSNIASPKKVMPSGARQSQRFHSKYEFANVTSSSCSFDCTGVHCIYTCMRNHLYYPTYSSF